MKTGFLPGLPTLLLSKLDRLDKEQRRVVWVTCVSGRKVEGREYVAVNESSAARERLSLLPRTSSHYANYPNTKGLLGRIAGVFIVTKHR